MASSPNRRFLTDFIKERLEAEEILTGVEDSPPEGGWDNDPQEAEENSQYFPYTMILPLTSLESSGPVNDQGGDWILPYAFTSYGISRFSTEDQADTVRKIVHETQRLVLDLGGESWRVLDVRTSTIGGLEINKSVKPYEVSQRDVVSVRITKRSN